MKLTKHPSFCYITPTSYLHPYAASSTTHLALAHLVDADPVYADYYLQRSKQGDFIMMDNSAYEMKVPYAPHRLVQLGAACGAKVIVLPDYPFQPAQKTIQAAITNIPIFKSNGFGTFFVPQSLQGDLDDWISGYRWATTAADVDVIGMSILGIPNALNKIEPAYARVVMTQLLIDRGLFDRTKHHHYLGLNAGPALEIPSLLRMEALDTIDSSNPVWMAILGHEYSRNADSYLATRKINMPVDFYNKLSKDSETHRRIKHNILLTEELFHGAGSGGPTRVWYAEE